MAGDLVGAGVFDMQQHIGEVQANAGHQNSGDWHQGQPVPAGRQPGMQNGAFVFAKQPFDPLQGYRVDVPGVAADVVNLAYLQVMRRVKAVVHGRCQAQRDINTAFECVRMCLRLKQFSQRIAKPLGLKQLALLDGTAFTHNAVAGAGQHLGVVVYHAGAWLEAACKTVMQAGEIGMGRFREVQVGEQLPDADGRAAHPRAADFAQPADKARQRNSRYAVGQQEVDIFILENAAPGGQEGGVFHQVDTRLK